MAITTPQQEIFDYANATVRMPLLTRKMDDQLNEKKWDEAAKTNQELIALHQQLGDWLAKKMKTAK